MLMMITNTLVKLYQASVLNSGMVVRRGFLKRIKSVDQMPSICAISDNSSVSRHGRVVSPASRTPDLSIRSRASTTRPQRHTSSSAAKQS
ncbi:hypothetical protein ElyMa_002051000 [Elysia marginata]|uniref:Uncharacterized protein n=1 Tax=Elysia marginata TaxID=1093978 RepID=A0AAV4F924_9GAST|nr:hypothetical protein ElyMa_002051000 [Elysia marginata]